MVEVSVFKGNEDGSIRQESTRQEVGPRDVLIRVTHSGICGTDVHYRSSGIVLGHEGVGIVEEIGADVKRFQKGQRVGWGYLHSCCGNCKQCLTGSEIYCPERRLYGRADTDQGSMASHAVWMEDFIFHVPEGIDSRDAAPLMCGGATVFNILYTYGVKSTHRVGVVGIGGLGHLAIQFAAAMGCEVVAFSATNSKREEATRLGAREFVATQGVTELKVEAPVDHLIVTTSSQPDWSQLMPIVAAGGTIYPVSISGGQLQIPYMSLLGSALRVQGNIVAPRQVHKDMLKFAALHNIRPIVQEFALDKNGISEAFEALNKGSMRYRGVLKA